MRQRIWLVALALAACEKFEVKETEQPPPDAAATAPAPAPAAPAQAPAAVPLLTADGYGPLRIGMTRAEIEAALGADPDPAAGGPEPESCDQFRPARAPDGMLVMVQDERLTRISLIDGSAVRTEHGLGLGAAAAEVRARLGARVLASPHEYQDRPAEYLTWWSRGAPAAGQAYVEDPDARGIRYEVGGDGKVGSIHAGGDAIQLVEGCS